MSVHHVIFAILIIVFVGISTGLLLQAMKRESTSSEVQWEQLVARLAQVNKDAINLIATDLLDGRDEVAPEALYGMLGGLDGLLQIRDNCEVLVELATYVQRWHPEGVVVAEELRLASRELKWHVERLQGAAAAGHLKSTFPDNAQRVVTVYYRMSRQVLTLYEDTAFGDFTALKHAL